MNTDIIQNKICELSWNCSMDTQKSAIEFLTNVDEENMKFIFDKDRKDTWQNSVEVIRRIGYPKNKALLPNLVWLLMDVNWPGAIEAINILASLPKEIVIPLIEKSIVEAYENSDYMWLGGLKIIVNKCNYKLSDFSNKEVFCLLEYADF